MSWGWILGLLGGGSVIGFGALAFFAPQMIPAIMSALKTGIDLLAEAVRWLVFTPEGRQTLLAGTTVIALWWSYQSGQIGYDRGDKNGAAHQLAIDKPILAQARANERTLQAGLDRCNASVGRLKDEGDAKEAGLRAEIARLRATLPAVRGSYARLAPIRAAPGLCKSVDAVLGGTFK